MRNVTRPVCNPLSLSVMAAIAGLTFNIPMVSAQNGYIEEVTVVAKDYYSILPAEDTESAFGLSKSLFETPRSVTEVRSDLIEKFALRSVDDLVRLTPGAFTSSFFGIRGAMDIRGEPADNYYRGFRRVANPGAFNTIVRGAEKLEVLRGPVSPLYGSGSVGGQLNYTPKSSRTEDNRYVSGPHGSVNITAGSYDQKILSGDFGMPLTIGGKEGGFHVFAEIEDSGSHYHGYEPTSELLQIAFDFDLSDKTRLEFGGQYQSSDSIQVPGWNRVTQDLVDNGTYITGAPPSRNDPANPIGANTLTPQESGFISSAAGIGINDSFSGVGTFCVPTLGFNVANYNGRDITCFGGNSTPWISPLTNPGTTKIDHKTTFIDDEDYADSTAITLYGEITHTFDNDLVWTTEAFYDYMDHEKYQSWGFTAKYPDADVFELRTSLKFELSNDTFDSNNVVGVNFRREELDKRHAFFDETFDFRDITVGPTPDDRIAPAVLNPFDGVVYNYDANGNPTTIASGTVLRNYNETEVSVVDNAGLFFLSDITMDKWNLLIGGRYDTFDVEAEEKAVTLLQNPYSTEGKVTDTDDAVSYNVSLSYKFDSGFIPYITYAESNSLSTNQLGGIVPATVSTGSYLQPSELSEVGVKWEGMDGALYAALAYYEQEKSFREGETNALSAVYADGLEFELRAVLTDSFSILATATHSDTTEVSNDVITVINGAEFAAQNGLLPSDVYGGRISGARSTFIGENVELERGGLPDTIVSVYGTWTKQMESADITANLGFTWVDETYTDALQTVLLPDYMVWTGSISYVQDRFTALLQVNNLTDEEYYTSADLFDSVVVKPSEGRTFSLSLSYAFGD